MEYFIVDSWLDHMRQHERVTEADKALQRTVRAFHKGEERPVVRRDAHQEGLAERHHLALPSDVRHQRRRVGAA